MALDKGLDGFGRSLADLMLGEIDPAHARSRGERDEGGAELVNVPPAQVVQLLGEHDDAPPLRRLIGERGKLGRIRQFFGRHSDGRDELGGLAVAERDGAGLVEQEHVDIARRFHRPAGHRHDVGLAQPVHAGNADGRKQCADRGRRQAHQQGDQRRDRHDLALPGLHHAVGGIRKQRGGHHEEDDRQAGQQHVQGDLVRRLLPLGALDHGDHHVQERLARLGS